MSEWWTYRLADFLMFAPRTYYRLVELYNVDVWPLHLVAAAAGIAIVVLMRWRMSRAGRAICLLLAVAWAWVAWAFHYTRYATINWAATYFAVAFAIEAALLVAVALARRDRSHERQERDRAEVVGPSIVVVAVFVLPLAGLVEGRRWLELELFGLAPDATAVATLGALASGRVRSRWWLWPVPLAWCVIGGATSWTMRSPVAPLAPALALLAAWAAFARRSLRGTTR
jgi:hypothetical protein